MSKWYRRFGPKPARLRYTLENHRVWNKALRILRSSGQECLSEWLASQTLAVPAPALGPALFAPYPGSSSPWPYRPEPVEDRLAARHNFVRSPKAFNGMYTETCQPPYHAWSQTESAHFPNAHIGYGGCGFTRLVPAEPAAPTHPMDTVDAWRKRFEKVRAQRAKSRPPGRTSYRRPTYEETVEKVVKPPAYQALREVYAQHSIL